MWSTLILIILACCMPVSLGKWAGHNGVNGNRVTANIKFSLNQIPDQVGGAGNTIQQDANAATGNAVNFKNNNRLCCYMYSGVAYAAPTAAANRLLKIYKLAYGPANAHIVAFRNIPVSVVLRQAQPAGFNNAQANHATINVV